MTDWRICPRAKYNRAPPAWLVNDCARKLVTEQQPNKTLRRSFYRVGHRSALPWTTKRKKDSSTHVHQNSGGCCNWYFQYGGSLTRLEEQKIFRTTAVYSFCTVFIYLFFIFEVILSASDVDRKRDVFFLPFSLFQHIPGLDESKFP